MTGKGPNGCTVALMTIPSYFPVPPTVSLVTFPSVVEKYDNRLSPSRSMDSQTLVPVFFPARDADIPMHRNVSLSKRPPGGLLRIEPVCSKLRAVWVLENAIVLLVPDQHAV